MHKHDRSEEGTVFQQASPYNPKTDSWADAALVYWLDDTFEESVARWRKAGYRSQVMTGVAWDACYGEPWQDPFSLAGCAASRS